MNAPLLLGAAGAAAALLAYIGRAWGSHHRRGVGVVVNSDAQGIYSFDGIYQKYAAQTGLDWKLIKAIARVESGEDPRAVNPADPSTGLMQVLCTGPGADGRCTNKLNLPGWPPKRDDLFDVDTNVKFASGILAWNIKTYGRWRGVAVYNRWQSRKDPPTGPFGNQSYVDKVRAAYINLGGTP